MKKRLRKKLHLKEFREFGVKFNIEFNYPNNINNDKLMDAFIEFAEKNNTYCGGGGDNKKWEMVVEINKKEINAETLAGRIKDFFRERLKEGFELNYKIVDLWN